MLHCSFVIEALQTFLTKPSAVLRGFYQQRDVRPSRPKIFLSSDDTTKEDAQNVLIKPSQSNYDKLVVAALQAAIRYVPEKV